MKNALNNKIIHNIFSNQAKSTPDEIALIHGQLQITYKELEKITDNIAVDLVKNGVTSGSLVGVFLERSAEAICCMLGILKAGAAYVPIDITYPSKRIDYIVKDCSPSIILANNSTAPQLEKIQAPYTLIKKINEYRHPSEASTTTEVSPDSPAYVIYTSGTTGAPKGVIIPHKGVVRLVFGQDYINFGPKRVFLQLNSISFDIAAFEIWGPLLHGAQCVLYSEANFPDPLVLQHLILKHTITTLILSSSLFNTLISAASGCLSGADEIIVGGEALSPTHILRALTSLPHTRLINGYGPTENTVLTTCYNIPRDLNANCISIPIGTPLKNSIYYILNEQRLPVPTGEVGELYVGGEGLALGYLNQSKLTNEKFISISLMGNKQQRLYSTGDLVRELPDGTLDYVGRTDDQIKIRGYRVELGEITSAILKYPKVKNAVVNLYTDPRETKHIVAYYTTTALSIATKDIRNYLAEILPEHMCPAYLIELTNIPLNTNGKLDITKLPAPVSATQNNYIAPTTVMEKKLTHLWSNLLDNKQLSSTDNFFDVGGTSLLGIEMFSMINKTFNLDKNIEAVVIYQYPTIQSLAGYLAHESTPQETQRANMQRADKQKSAFNKFKKQRK
ncbi:MAG: amino acid adenylation domain-containing protein [Desulforhopalus sp.]|jgi:amino acid adenylation domain-containing protein